MVVEELKGSGVGGAPKGTVFTANDEEHTVVFRRSDICRSQTRRKAPADNKSLDGKQAPRADVRRCLFYACMHDVCLKQAG